MKLLSTPATLSIAAVMLIAEQGRYGEPVSAGVMTTNLGVKPRRLEVYLQALVHAGILVGVRGPRGGYTLTKSAVPTLAAIIEAVETVSIAEEPALPDCARRAVYSVDALSGPFIANLRKTTIFDLVADSSRVAAE